MSTLNLELSFKILLYRRPIYYSEISDLYYFESEGAFTFLEGCAIQYI